MGRGEMRPPARLLLEINEADSDTGRGVRPNEFAMNLLIRCSLWRSATTLCEKSRGEQMREDETR